MTAVAATGFGGLGMGFSQALSRSAAVSRVGMSLDIGPPCDHSGRARRSAAHALAPGGDDNAANDKDKCQRVI